MNHPAFSCYPDEGEDGINLRTQPEGDLGWRMRSAIRESAGLRGVVVIGTDCPALTPAHLRQAAERLQHRDAVIIPAEDGGYVLIGMRKPLRQTVEQVFEQIDWGSDRVMAQTRERLTMSGCTWDEPTTLWDVDRPEDLPRLFALCPELAQIAGFEVGS
jgi:rSAM/selenodomain-associated transferase 1